MGWTTNSRIVRSGGLTPAGWSRSSESLAAHDVGGEGSMTMTTRKSHSPEQVVRKLAQADRMLGEGKESLASAASYRSPSRPITAGATSSAG